MRGPRNVIFEKQIVQQAKLETLEWHLGGPAEDVEKQYFHKGFAPETRSSDFSGLRMRDGKRHPCTVTLPNASSLYRNDSEFRAHQVQVVPFTQPHARQEFLGGAPREARSGRDEPWRGGADLEKRGATGTFSKAEI